ncbi:MAG: hypothetical protein M1828_006934 [Chrysothrix sp. TS-e1954]|nr:MAG: hypothetical protein M1828_006934 [Chrysothrix sp. TS-e1954]
MASDSSQQDSLNNHRQTHSQHFKAFVLKMNAGSSQQRSLKSEGHTTASTSMRLGDAQLSSSAFTSREEITSSSCAISPAACERPTDTKSRRKYKSLISCNSVTGAGRQGLASDGSDGNLSQTSLRKSSIVTSSIPRQRNTSLDIDEKEEILKQKLLTTLPLLFQALDMEYADLRFLASGSSNLVYSFRATSGAPVQDFVVRIPISDSNGTFDDTPELQAGVLSYLNHVPTLERKIPHVIRFDATKNNPIDRQYIIQERMRGDCLADLYDKLTTEQSKSLARCYADQILAFEKITFPRAGEITTCPGSSGENPSTEINVVDWRDYDDERPRNHGTPRAAKETIYQLLSRRFSAAIRKETRSKYRRRNLFILKQILRDMKELGWFDSYNSDHPIVLAHADLYPRNIMVRWPTRQSLEITGVLDWDDVRALPRVLSRRPPTTLWEGEFRTRGCFVQDPDFYGELEAEPCTQGAVIKEYFDKYMSERDENWISEAYGKGLWLRRLAKFALRDWSSNEDFEAIRWLQKQWITFYYRIQHDQVNEAGVVDTPDGEDYVSSDDGEDHGNQDVGEDEDRDEDTHQHMSLANEELDVTDGAKTTRTSDPPAVSDGSSRSSWLARIHRQRGTGSKALRAAKRSISRLRQPAHRVRPARLTGGSDGSAAH